MLALVATRTVSREPLMGSTDRREESHENERGAPGPANPTPLRAEEAAPAPRSSAVGKLAGREGPRGRFLTALLRALSTWPT
jgi:hypothetical protein